MLTSDANNAKNPLEEAQLRKLELEIEALKRAASEEERVGISKQEKVKLEVDMLVWQTGRVYRLSQFAVIFSVLATLVTIFATTYGIWSSYVKDNETRVKERSDRTDALYRSGIQRLIQYPVEQKMTISDAVFTFRDLEEIVSNSYDDEKKRERQKHEVGILLAQLTKSPEFDLSVTRNVEFDRKAIYHSALYREFLVKNPGYNRDILSKYKDVLENIRKTAPCYSLIPSQTVKEVFFERKCSNGESQPTFLQYSALFYAYKSHVALFNATAEVEGLSEEAATNQNLSFCWFTGATNNVELTIEIFGGDAEKVAWKRNAECQGG